MTRDSLSVAAVNEVKNANPLALIPAIVGTATYVLSPEFLGVLPDQISHKLLGLSIFLGLFFPQLRKKL